MNRYAIAGGGLRVHYVTGVGTLFYSLRAGMDWISRATGDDRVVVAGSMSALANISTTTSTTN